MKMPFGFGNIFGKNTAAVQPQRTGGVSQRPPENQRDGRFVKPEAPPVSILPPPPESDAFTVKVTAPPYFFESVWHGGRWVANPLNLPPAMAKWFLGLMEKRGLALTTADKALLVENTLKDRVLTEKICLHGFSGAAAMFAAQRGEIRSEIAAGKDVATDRLQSREEIYQNSLMIRQECRELQKDLAARTFKILNPFCENVRKLARELVEEIDAEERKAATFFEFQPSQKLRVLIWLALAGWKVPIANYFPGSHHLLADQDFFGVPLIEVPKNESALAAAKQVKRDQQSLGITAAEQFKRSGTVTAEQAEEHRKKVAEISAQNEKFREEGETAIAKLRAEKTSALAAGLAEVLLPLSQKHETQK